MASLSALVVKLFIAEAAVMTCRLEKALVLGPLVTNRWPHWGRAMMPDAREAAERTIGVEQVAAGCLLACLAAFRERFRRFIFARCAELV